MKKCAYKHCNKEFEGRANQKFCREQCGISFHILKNRKNNKERAVKFKGGKCERCGYDKSKRALTFHHLDPAKKDFTISHNNQMSWERIQSELEKCIMLCANCHAEEHDPEMNHVGCKI